MITLTSPQSINWETVQAVAYDNATVSIAPDLLARVEAGRKRFQQLIEDGIPCYGVTTGLGDLVTVKLSEAERQDLPHNILRARAAAIGAPLPKPVVRALMLCKLFNFLTGADGVSVELCQFLVDRLNDGFTPWVPSLGHGMAADATAHTHTFQTFIGEGYVLTDEGTRITAASALAARNAAPMQLGKKEGLALLNGIAAAPAYAMDMHRQVKQALDLATAVSAVASEAVAAPQDSLDAALLPVVQDSGTAIVIAQMQPYLEDSDITPVKLQSAVSYRIIPQVHGALWDALTVWQQQIENAIHCFSDNPWMDADDGRFLSVGVFHNQHLVNQAEQIAIALAHVGALSVRRLHRLLMPINTGLNPQLAPRPGLDAGLVVAHKAAVGIASRLKQLANPVSLYTDETSVGQEDYMSLAISTMARLPEMVKLTEMILAYEMLGALTALNQRGVKAGLQTEVLRAYFADKIDPLEKDRSPGPDVETVLATFAEKNFRNLL